MEGKIVLVFLKRRKSCRCLFLPTFRSICRNKKEGCKSKQAREDITIYIYICKFPVNVERIESRVYMRKHTCMLSRD